MTDDESRSRGRPPGADAETAACPPDGIAVRRATSADVAAVLRAVEGALLAVDAERVRGRIDAGEVLVAVTGTGTVVGALVRDGDRLVAVAVSPRRRRQGIGRALVERALGEADRLTAAFGPRVRGFYEALGFDVGAPPADGAGRADGSDRMEGDEGAAGGPDTDPAGAEGDPRDDPPADGDRSDRLWGVRRG